MARARNIKPGLFVNDELAEVDPLGRLLFIGLWTIADREGRLKDRPKKIKAQTLPFDNCDIDNLLKQLEEYGFICRYNSNDCKLIQINNFTKHQNPHVNEAVSELPAPDNSDTNTIQEPETSDTNPADSLLLINDSLKPITGIPDKPRAAKFVPPTVTEINKYCKERKNSVDAEKFRDFYQSKNWMVGKNKMSDWEAAVRTWEKADKEIKPVDRRVIDS